MVRRKTTARVVWSVEEYHRVAAFFTVLKEIHQEVAADKSSSSKSKKTTKRTSKKTKPGDIRTRSPAGSFFCVAQINNAVIEIDT